MVKKGVKKSHRTQPQKGLSLYSNLAQKRKHKKESSKHARAAYLATLPKNPWKRFVHFMNPQVFWSYWFSKRGALMFVKIVGIFVLFVALVIGGLFAYFRKDLDQISPESLAKKVQSSVNKYYDRNGVLLWEDTGGGNYRLVVDSDQLSKNLKNATVAIEDKNFYTEGGVSFSGTLRAAVSTLSGGQVQGGSTLTQQLVKQVFLSDEATNRSGIAGISRKIKEAILAIEVDRTYSKDQILTMYLNQSPYGGPRNGAESGAETYFGKPAKDLTVAEAALLAAIPQNPSFYNPYNTDGNEYLVARQHAVIDAMRAQGYITKAQADEAKAYPILDHIQAAPDQSANMKAPHFVQYVKSQLESQLGTAVMGQGGLTITTTLDYRIQSKLEDSMTEMFSGSSPSRYGFSNGAATVEDTQTGQIVAMVGSRSYSYPGYGQDNAAIAMIQPGSTIKPLVYAQLFTQKTSGQPNFGSGSKLVNDNIDSIYGSQLTNAASDPMNNGAVSIRQGLANSYNIPAVEAMAIDGVTPSINTIHNLGGTSYCTQGSDTQVGLAAAIGGCTIRQVDLVNAYASLGRGGVYKPQSTVLEVKNTSGQTLVKWSDTAGKQVVDPQAAYVVSDILHDDRARTFVGVHRSGMYIPGVDSAAKTGTTNYALNANYPKDIWMVNYSQSLTMAVWLGNSDTTPLKSNATSIVPGPILDETLQYAYKTVYEGDGKWKAGDWIAQPKGIQRTGCSSNTLVTGNGKFDQGCGEVYPSYWNSTQGLIKVDFDSISKKLATSCTPDSTKVSVSVIKITLAAPHSDKALYIDPTGVYGLRGGLPDGNGNYNDDIHHCNADGSPADSKPVVGAPTYSGGELQVTVTAGTNPVTTVVFHIDGQDYTASLTSNNIYKTSGYSGPAPASGDYVKATDAAGYTAQASF